ncbi:PREDICTED: snRNA-activating protein complex subunit 4-like [Priapulus caudatus]|uniref:snRNA-activating protein complex subunit 4-like n=1 Tax=Priapulus caudatus TaxID=37621 RepID=A0ABM1EUP3_PRICU|nr:PREDICTED: snRNA-activating protein complex subunit 4-like [Priapulus caudatus]
MAAMNGSERERMEAEIDKINQALEESGESMDEDNNYEDHDAGTIGGAMTFPEVVAKTNVQMIPVIDAGNVIFTNPDGGNLDPIHGLPLGNVEMPTSSNFSGSDLPNTPDTCLLLNRVYQEIVFDTIHDVEALLAANREHQKNCQTELDNNSKLSGKRAAPLTQFCKPYFRDYFGMCPPCNEETSLRNANKVPDALPRRPRQWSFSEINMLKSAVRSNVLKQQMEKHLAKKECWAPNYKNQPCSYSESNEMDTSDKDLYETYKDIKIDWLRISVTDFENSRSAIECQLKWENEASPLISQVRWVKQEDEKVKSLVEIKKEKNWRKIAKEVGSCRTAFQCFQRYQTRLNDSLTKKNWTAEEDKQLTKVVNQCRVGDYIPWNYELGINYGIAGTKRSTPLCAEASGKSLRIW